LKLSECLGEISEAGLALLVEDPALLGAVSTAAALDRGRATKLRETPREEVLGRSCEFR
jgi:hypothetical protein